MIAAAARAKRPGSTGPYQAAPVRGLRTRPRRPSTFQKEPWYMACNVVPRATVAAADASSIQWGGVVQMTWRYISACWRSSLMATVPHQRQPSVHVARGFHRCADDFFRASYAGDQSVMDVGNHAESLRDNRRQTN